MKKRLFPIFSLSVFTSLYAQIQIPSAVQNYSYYTAIRIPANTTRVFAGMYRFKIKTAEQRISKNRW